MTDRHQSNRLSNGHGRYLRAGLIDELHVAVSPVILGNGESLFAGMDLLKLRYQCTEHITTPAAMYAVLTK
jgi:dihydrofolate reductase